MNLVNSLNRLFHVKLIINDLKICIRKSNETNSMSIDDATHSINNNNTNKNNICSTSKGEESSTKTFKLSEDRFDLGHPEVEE